MRKFLPLVLALVLMAPLSLVPSAVQGFPLQNIVSIPSVSDVGFTDATLDAVVTTTPDCCSVEVHFEYGTDLNALDQTTASQYFDDCQNPVKPPTLGSHNFSAVITGLRPCTTYYARAVVNCRGVAKSPGSQCIAGFGLDPVTMPALLNAQINLNQVITFTTLCPPANNSHGSAGYGVTMGTTIRPYLPPMFEVQNATVAASKAGPGDQVEVTATITNKGGSNGTTKVILYVNGQEADSKGVALSSGQSTPVSFKVSRNDPGTYSVYVNGVSAGSFTVDMFSSNDILIYCSIALFVVGIVGLLYYLNKRRTAA